MWNSAAVSGARDTRGVMIVVLPCSLCFVCLGKANILVLEALTLLPRDSLAAGFSCVPSLRLRPWAVHRRLSSRSRPNFAYRQRFSLDPRHLLLLATTHQPNGTSVSGHTVISTTQTRARQTRYIGYVVSSTRPSSTVPSAPEDTCPPTPRSRSRA
jgi:hypothetical protein